MHGRLLVVPAGCLDTDISIVPQGHIYISHKANWDNDLHKIQIFEELPL